ncbi:hypothetical protein WME75_33155 [Sorangium sp. So ce1014]|uniref:hypothetical protein n=1 Tax=Sorangium sp. So ce1014 TaxID=3133326 RepID=UPI003F5FFE15
MRARRAAACAFAAWVSGCQVVAPLPGADGEGGGPSAERTGVDGDAAARDAGDAGDGGQERWAPPTQETGPCEIAACSAHCARSMDLCELTPQYPSVEACCAVCEAMPSPAGYAGCRAVESGDPAGCTSAGPLGPAGGAGCVGRCEAMCTLYGAMCPRELADIVACEALCAILPAPQVFDACGSLTAEGSLGCSTQQIYAALGAVDKKARDKVCRDILEGRCPHPACADGD